MKPGSVKGLHLVVGDVREAREALAGRGDGVARSWSMIGASSMFLQRPGRKLVGVSGDAVEVVSILLRWGRRMPRHWLTARQIVAPPGRR